MFWTGAVHAVRQQNRQRGIDAPLRFSARDVRVENYLNLNFAGYLTFRGAKLFLQPGGLRMASHLSCVEKISELRLPNDEVGGTLHRHSVLETHHGLLGQVAVGHLELTASWG